MFDKLIVSDSTKLIIQLTRIANALEILNGTYKSPDEEKTTKVQTLELLEDETEKVAAEEIEEKREIISKKLEANKGKFLWAEDNVDSEFLEDIQNIISS